MLHQSTYHHRWSTVLGGLALMVCLAVSPLVSHAIPLAGNYVFTSGINGNFTSTGTQLSAWNFVVNGSSYVWSSSDVGQLTTENNDVLFFSEDSTSSHSVAIAWPLTSLAYLATDNIVIDTFDFKLVNVPEPTSLGLLGVGLGLLALVAYMRRQWRQIGVQVG